MINNYPGKTTELILLKIDLSSSVSKSYGIGITLAPPYSIHLT
jgi:hypothetical protein